MPGIRPPDAGTPAEPGRDAVVIEASDVVAIVLLAGIAATLAVWLIRRPMP